MFRPKVTLVLFPWGKEGAKSHADEIWLSSLKTVRFYFTRVPKRGLLAYRGKPDSARTDTGTREEISRAAGPPLDHPRLQLEGLCQSRPGASAGSSLAAGQVSRVNTGSS